MRGPLGQRGRSGVRTFTVDQDLCAISVCAHEHGILVNLRVGQASLAIDNFQELQGGG